MLNLDTHIVPDVLHFNIMRPHGSERLDFRSDPADQIIAATSLAFDVPLVTRDSRVLASKVIPFALA